MNKNELKLYRDLLGEIKTRVRQAQHRAALSANAEMLLMYWDIGRMIAERQQLEGWGAAVIPRLAADLKSELPEQKGFSERNLKYMIRFAREYGDPPTLAQRNSIGPPVQRAAAQIAFPLNLILSLPWFHHVVLFEKLKDLPTRLWYAEQALQQGWSRDTLTAQIKSSAHTR